MDVFPHRYPCITQGTAVMSVYDDERIDCDATQAAHGCPWRTAMVGRGTPVVGMLGTDCWYRGKAGTWMLDELQGHGYHLPEHLREGFYGIDGETPELSSEYCIELATWMEDHAEAYASLPRQIDTDDDNGRSAIDRYMYATWWVRWVGENCDGARSWW